MANTTVTVTTSSTDLAISGSIHFISITNLGSYPVYIHVGDNGTAVAGTGIALLSTGSSWGYESGKFFLGGMSAIAVGGNSALSIAYL